VPRLFSVIAQSIGTRSRVLSCNAAQGCAFDLCHHATLSKRMVRDRIQNHAMQDISLSYMPEQRAAMKQWDKFVRALLSKKRLKLVA
jgi:hypothetical protein